MNFDKHSAKRLMLVLCGAIFFAFFLFEFEKVTALFFYVIKLLLPFIIGFCIAFIINVPMKAYERVLFKNKKSKLYKFKRPVSLVLAVVSIAAVLTFVITMLIPELADTFTAVGEKFPGFMERVEDRFTKLTKDYPDIFEKINNIEIDWKNVTNTVIKIVGNGGPSLVAKSFVLASSVLGLLVNVIIGIFFAIYILTAKETLEKQTKGLIYSVMKEKKADKIITTCAMADKAFTAFISGQCLEACILGMMFFVSMSILQIPYAIAVSITITITALIPVFGSFMGCGVGAFLILVADPHKAVVFLILFIILQQIEGNLIYPHVVGGTVGLPSIWVLVAVVLGGNLMGVLGMLIFVPLTSVAYAVTHEYVAKTLKEKKIPKEKIEEDV